MGDRWLEEAFERTSRPDRFARKNLPLVLARFDTQPAGPGGCTHRLWETHAGFDTCQQCGFSRKTSCAVSRRTRSGLYKCIHYATALLKAYKLQDTAIPVDVVEAARERWLRAGRPALTKRNIQWVLRTRSDPMFRRYLKNWRQLRFRLTGEQPPALSKAVEARILVMFIRMHAAFLRADMYAKSGRVSFMSFAFTFRRSLELLGLDALKEHFPGLRGADKFVFHYRMYAELCRRMRVPIIVSAF